MEMLRGRSVKANLVVCGVPPAYENGGRRHICSDMRKISLEGNKTLVTAA